jgi:hypothetical protein
MANMFLMVRAIMANNGKYLFNESEHIYWILDLENQMHSIWVI